MKKWLFIIIASLILLLSGCATNHALIMPNKDFKSYKAAYIELLQEDEFNIGTFTIQELSDMGFQVFNKRVPADPLATDMLVRYTYAKSWDLSVYLVSYQILFLDARSEAVIAQLGYRLNGNWRSSQTRKIEGFNELRSKLGYPPSKMVE